MDAPRAKTRVSREGLGLELTALSRVTEVAVAGVWGGGGAGRGVGMGREQGDLGPTAGWLRGPPLSGPAVPQPRWCPSRNWRTRS